MILDVDRFSDFNALHSRKHHSRSAALVYAFDVLALGSDVRSAAALAKDKPAEAVSAAAEWYHGGTV
ncbi:hypothetical protein [Bradyrhizobium sp. RDM4]|uniref:hypothetical protein n=1 Tax=Bradyrhizobium sp. RDM4 TaxID=3378765 RepID=UPI0038FC6E55